MTVSPTATVPGREDLGRVDIELRFQLVEDRDDVRHIVEAIRPPADVAFVGADLLSARLNAQTQGGCR